MTKSVHDYFVSIDKPLRGFFRRGTYLIPPGAKLYRTEYNMDRPETVNRPTNVEIDYLTTGRGSKCFGRFRFKGCIRYIEMSGIKNNYCGRNK